jgi:hypothetical protein
VNEKNTDALLAYCEILLKLREMQDKDNLSRRKAGEKVSLLPRNAVINRMISHAIRNATDSAHPFGYSDSGKYAAQWISEDALTDLRNGNPSCLICEHVIPVSVLTSEMFSRWDKECWDTNRLKSFFESYSITAIVSDRDNEQLKSKGVHQAMPPGKVIDDKFSRYELAGIQLVGGRLEKGQWVEDGRTAQ